MVMVIGSSPTWNVTKKETEKSHQFSLIPESRAKVTLTDVLCMTSQGSKTFFSRQSNVLN